MWLYIFSDFACNQRVRQGGILSQDLATVLAVRKGVIKAWFLNRVYLFQYNTHTYSKMTVGPTFKLRILVMLSLRVHPTQ